MTSPAHLTDPDRVGSLFDLPYQSLLCAYRGHRWDDPPLTAEVYVGVSAERARLTCDCGRVRTDVIHAKQGGLLARDYNGGTLLMPGCNASKNEARLELIRRKRANEAGAGDLGRARRARTTRAAFSG